MSEAIFYKARKSLLILPEFRAERKGSRAGGYRSGPSGEMNTEKLAPKHRIIGRFPSSQGSNHFLLCLFPVLIGQSLTTLFGPCIGLWYRP